MAQRQIGQTHWATALGLTALAVAAAAFGAPAKIGKPRQKLMLSGKVSGVAPQPAAQAKTASEFRMSGTGNVSPLGHVTASVVLRNPHGGALSRAGSIITLTSPRGSVDLTLESKAGFGFTGKPTHAAFRISSGTGACANAGGSGDAEITLNPEYRPPHIPGRMTPMYIRAATFSISLEGKAAE